MRGAHREIAIIIAIITITIITIIITIIILLLCYYYIIRKGIFNKAFLHFRARRRDVSHIIIIIDYYWHTTIIISPPLNLLPNARVSSFIISGSL